MHLASLGALESNLLLGFGCALQAEAARDAVIKAIYTKLFDWIVTKVNAFISGGDSAAALPYVGLLDIFGFENFAHNSFEQVQTRVLTRGRMCWHLRFCPCGLQYALQLCINFANEKLQQFFLTCVFKEEEALHIKEGVPWKNIEFQDNEGCILMLEKPPSTFPIFSRICFFLDGLCMCCGEARHGCSHQRCYALSGAQTESFGYLIHSARRRMRPS